MKTAVILNAPPFSGKDTIADLCVKHLGAVKQEFKESLYEAVAEHFKYDLKLFKHFATSRKYKDNLSSHFSLSEHSKGLGYTPREALIYVSEEVMKPLYGPDYFGECAAEKLVDGLNVFADGGGWWDELTPVAQAVDRIIICRLYRQGYTFDGDSRQYYDANQVPEVADENNKLSICDIHLEEGNPIAALDSIGAMIL